MIAPFENIKLRVEVRGCQKAPCMSGGWFGDVATDEINFSHPEWRIVRKSDGQSLKTSLPLGRTWGRLVIRPYSAVP
jgi:hypothetical protein